MYYRLFICMVITVYIFFPARIFTVNIVFRLCVLNLFPFGKTNPICDIHEKLLRS